MKTISLYFRDSKSDKVYSLAIDPRPGGYVVTYANGKRGGTLARGSKSSFPTPLDVAERLFDKILKSKLADGYTESPDGKPFGGDVVKLRAVLPHPNKTLIPFAERSQLECSDGLLTRKYDGETGDRRLENVQIMVASPRRGNVRLLGEFMRTEISGHFYTAADRAMFRSHPQGWFAVFRIMEIEGVNVIGWSTRQQRMLLCDMQHDFPPDMILAELVKDIGYVIGQGAEGVCWCDWEAPFGEMLCVKQNQIYNCRVTRTDSTQSVGICDAETGADRGNVKMGGGACDQIRVGSIVRIEGVGLTVKGLIREPKKCREYLVQF